jgi:ferredoxin-type protein NapF
MIDKTCLAARGVVCQACGDLCAARALRFPPRLGGIAIPVLDVSACTGCGACVAPCPAQAISLREVA